MPGAQTNPLTSVEQQSLRYPSMLFDGALIQGRLQNSEDMLIPQPLHDPALDHVHRNPGFVLLSARVPGGYSAFHTGQAERPSSADCQALPLRGKRRGTEGGDVDMRLANLAVAVQP